MYVFLYHCTGRSAHSSGLKWQQLKDRLASAGKARRESMSSLSGSDGMKLLGSWNVRRLEELATRLHGQAQRAASTFQKSKELLNQEAHALARVNINIHIATPTLSSLFSHDIIQSSTLPHTAIGYTHAGEEQSRDAQSPQPRHHRATRAQVGSATASA